MVLKNAVIVVFIVPVGTRVQTKEAGKRQAPEYG